MASCTLVCHPVFTDPAVRHITADVHCSPDGILSLTYVLAADLARLRLPPPSLPRRVDGLWKHSCFEAFVSADGVPGYLEFNFSPSGGWAAYRFQGYRAPGPLPDVTPPHITWRADADRLQLAVAVRLAGLLPMPPAAKLRLGLAAVVEDAAGALSYWALRHPADKPDFHHSKSFALSLG